MVRVEVNAAFTFQMHDGRAQFAGQQRRQALRFHLQWFRRCAACRCDAGQRQTGKQRSSKQRTMTEAVRGHDGIPLKRKCRRQGRPHDAVEIRSAGVRPA
ncbi:hypothetical protein D3C72_2243860 [compost metagenome]